MTIQDLKIDQEVLINGFPYTYKGIQKISKKNFGKVESIVFEGSEITGDKHFDKKLLTKELKELRIEMV